MNTDIPVSSHALFDAIIDNWDVDTTHTHILRLARDWGYNSFGVELARKLLEQAGYEVSLIEEEKEPSDASGGEWLLWFGGDCPVGSRALVDVRWSDGSVDMGSEANCWRWDWISPSAPNITHYRVVEDRLCG